MRLLIAKVMGRPTLLLRQVILLGLSCGAAAVLAPVVYAQGYPPVPTAPAFNPAAGREVVDRDTAALGRAAPAAPSYTRGANYTQNTLVAPAYGGYPPTGYFGTPASQNLAAAGAAMSGAADLTVARGQYEQDIQAASMQREQARQASYDTRKKQLDFEMDYEKYKLTTLKMREKDIADEREMARKAPQATDIWSGKTLNALYRSILTPGHGPGPNIPIEDKVLKGINFNTKTSRGSLGLLKDNGRLSWPIPLQDATYDEVRDRFSKNFAKMAADMNRDGDGPNIKTMRELRADLDSLSAILDGQAKDLSPSDYIGSRRFINQMKDTMKALADPNLTSASTKLPPSVRTVADLVSYMGRNGLEFAPAVAPGDAPAYTTLYYSMRAYEMSALANR